MVKKVSRVAAMRGGLLVGILAMAGVSMLPACSNTKQDAASQPVNVKAAWVEFNDQNQAVARAITTYADCPLINIDGISSRMLLRVAPSTPAQRPTASAPADSKPSVFPVTVCEATLPSTAKSVTLASRSLPVPKAQPQRIVVIGDTGCRMKKSGNAFQACNDVTQWPFATIAAQAAAMKPDLVLHVGDYHYRENVCPDGVAGCAGSPWGYGWDVWNADLFTPAASLLSAAPWIVVRGNHESCTRGGQGWFRFLDPQAYDPARSCDDATNDYNAEYSAPYAVPVGSDAQVIVFDSSRTTGKALPNTDPQFVNYQQQFQKVAALASNSHVTSIFTNHHPILGFVPQTGAAPLPGDQALQSVMNSLNSTAYYPTGVQMAMHGHVHDFQAVDFSSGHPATVVAGIAGDLLDVNLPDPFPMSAQPANGATVDAITHTSNYGFLVMDRGASGASWTIKAYAVGSTSPMATCTFTAGTSAASAGKISCDKSGFVSP